MNRLREKQVRDALRATEVDSQARERSWEVIRLAAQAAPARRHVHGRRRLALLLAAVLVLAAVPAALGRPGEQVARAVRDALGLEAATKPRPALVRLPGGGRLLVASGSGVWVVSPRGTRRRLGDYAGADWSPRGLFVAAWRGRQLAAVTPTGSVRWALSRPQPVSVARWAPGDGFRIAYVSGGALRLVNGDGTGDRPLASAAGTAVPEWRPQAQHVLAHADRDRVRIRAVDGRESWRSPRLGRIVSLSWAPDGRRLAALTPDALHLLSPTGRPLVRRPMPAGTRGVGLSWSPHGDTLAMVRRRVRVGTEEVALLPAQQLRRERVLFGAASRLGAPTWAPGGDRVLVPWPEADQWVFLPRDRSAAPEVVSAISRQFAPGAQDPEFTGALSWCCA